MWISYSAIVEFDLVAHRRIRARADFSYLLVEQVIYPCQLHIIKNEWRSICLLELRSHGIRHLKYSELGLLMLPVPL